MSAEAIAKVRAVVEAAQESQSDVRALMALHTEDAVIVNLAGRRVRGRADFERVMRFFRVGPMTTSLPRRTVGTAAAVIALSATLTACSSAERFDLEATAPLEAESPLEADLAVLSVTESSVEETGLEGLFGTEVDGVPWLVGYRVDLTAGSREDFSWEAITDLSSEQWVARTDKTKVQASIVNSGSENLCPEQDTEPEEPVLMYGCRVFVVPEGQHIESITVDDVGAWSVPE